MITRKPARDRPCFFPLFLRGRKYRIEAAEHIGDLKFSYPLPYFSTTVHRLEHLQPLFSFTRLQFH